MTKPMRPPLTLPLKAKLGIGAAALGLLALLAAWLVVGGMGQMSRHMQAVLQAESRIDRYSVLSTQIGRYLVVATEAIQTGLDESDRAARLEKLALDVTATFAQLHDDTEKAVAAAGSLGLNEQSRRATISLSIARMQAQFNATHRVLQAPAQSRERLQGYIDSFAIGFDPNLNAAISEELRGRAKIRDQIDELQQRLTRWGYGVGALAIGLAVVSYLGVIRPQFRRLTQLQVASRQIGAQNFAVSLPETPRDEIGLLFAETNQMARALALRKSEVTSEWARLNETIAQRTEDLRQANAALTQQDQNRRRFFADISHELRTPLTVIMMEAQIGQAVPDPDLAAAFTTIRHRAERLNRRVDDLLRVARSESGQLDLMAERVEMVDMVTEAVAETQSEAGSHGVQLDCGDLCPALVIGDANWLRQVTTELVRNGLRHASAGGQILVTLSVSQGQAELRVIDNGPGISAQDQTHLLQRFGKGQGSAGFGIGLALSKWVVEAQGGELQLLSPTPEPDRLGAAPGTTVLLVMPLAEG